MEIQSKQSQGKATDALPNKFVTLKIQMPLTSTESWLQARATHLKALDVWIEQARRGGMTVDFIGVEA